MKKLVLTLIIVLSIATLASAEILVTANPLGQGKWAVLGAGRYDMNSQANSNMYALGGFVGYGINSKLDLYAKAGYGLGANLAAGTTALNGIALALAAKYTFIEESAKGSPVSVAGAVGYEMDTINGTFTIPGGSVSLQNVLGDVGIGVIVSKMAIPWIPYGGLVYHNLNGRSGILGTSGSGSRIEVAVGTYLALAIDKAIVGEFSYNSYSLYSTTWTNNQLSLAYCQKF